MLLYWINLLIKFQNTTPVLSLSLSRSIGVRDETSISQFKWKQKPSYLCIGNTIGDFKPGIIQMRYVSEFVWCQSLFCDDLDYSVRRKTLIRWPDFMCHFYLSKVCQSCKFKLLPHLNFALLLHKLIWLIFPELWPNCQLRTTDWQLIMSS